MALLMSACSIADLLGYAEIIYCCDVIDRGTSSKNVKRFRESWRTYTCWLYYFFLNRAHRKCRKMINRSEKKYATAYETKIVELYSYIEPCCTIFLRATLSGVNYSDRSSYQLGTRRCSQVPIYATTFPQGEAGGANLRSPITRRSWTLTCNIHAATAIF